MLYTKTSSGYIIRLLKDESLISTLTQFCTQNKIHSGIFHGIGAAIAAEIGFYDLAKKEYKWKKLAKSHEIVSLTGNVSLVHNVPFLHIHTILSSPNFSCVGGHLKELTVGATCEIFLTDLEVSLTRTYDEQIGLKLLDCTNKY